MAAKKTTNGQKRSAGAKAPSRKKAAAQTPRTTADKRDAKKGTKAAARRARLAAEPKRPASMEEWFEGVRAHAATAEAAGSERGACLVADPAGGPRMCLFVDRKTCTMLRGTFLGGPC